MKDHTFDHNEISIELKDFQKVNQLNLKEKDGLVSRFVCQQKLGVWSKQNGIEWDHELNWVSHSKLALADQTNYRFALSEKHPLKFEIEEYNHPNINLCFRKLTIYNHSELQQDLKLFFQQDFSHHGTTFFSISDRTLYHESDGVYMLFNGLIDKKGIVQYTTLAKNDSIPKRILDEENGSLTFNPISMGKGKSAFSLETNLLPFEVKSGYYWIAVGMNIKEVNNINQFVKNNPEWIVQDFIENDFCDLDKIIPISK